MWREISVPKVLAVAVLTLLCTGSGLRAQVVFEGCGELQFVAPLCVQFFPDSGEYSAGLFRSGWGEFGEGDHIFVAGLVDLDCGSVCGASGCLGGAIIEACLPVPTLSHWGVVVLVLLLLGAGTLVIRRCAPHRRVWFLVVVLGVSTPPSSNEAMASQRAGSMLESPHHPHHLLVRFKAGTLPQVRLNAHQAAGAVRRKAYRFVTGLELGIMHRPLFRLPAMFAC